MEETLIPSEAAATANKENSTFWDSLCGSGLAKALGITDFSLRSLAIYDNSFMSYYAYLYDWIPFEQLVGKEVLEVGLGYGTVGHTLASARANYHGLDVAKGPVDLINLRLSTFGFTGRAVQGSVLAAPFPDNSFDHIVSIGCLHHTGDIAGAMREASRMLRPGGQLMMMVYYAYSYRLWRQRGVQLAKDLWNDIFNGTLFHEAPAANVLYDANEAGDGAPHTVFVSKRQLRRLAKQAGLIVSKSQTENAAAESPFTKFTRKQLLGTVGKIAGTDLYTILQKPLVQ